MSRDSGLEPFQANRPTGVASDRVFRGAVTFKRRGKRAAIPLVKEGKTSPMLRITFQSYLPKCGRCITTLRAVAKSY